MGGCCFVLSPFLHFFCYSTLHCMNTHPGPPMQHASFNCRRWAGLGGVRRREAICRSFPMKRGGLQ